MGLFPFTKEKKKNLVVAVLLAIVLMLVDQWLKVVAVRSLKGMIGHTYLDGLVVIEYAENRGAFLSLGASLSDSARLWIFVIGVIFILAFCLYTMARSLADFWTTVAFSLVVSGGMGNLIDRIAQGYVVDYIHMGFGGLRTGVFNLADVAISGGLILLVFFQYKHDASGAQKL